MGLYAEFAPEDLGYKLEFHNDQYGIVVEVDYSEALQECSDTFLQIATTIVPVDTGFLQSTLNSESDDFSVFFEASAEYAEFVEYGTWKQEPQPYFRPALEGALQIFIALADQAQADAKEEFDSQVENESGGTIISYNASLNFAAVIYFLLLYPIFVNFYAFLQMFKDMFGEQFGTEHLKNEAGLIAENLIQIIETEDEKGSKTQAAVHKLQQTLQTKQ